MNPLVLAFYGDDFTGSTDVMEACVRNGLPAVLFLAPPKPGDLAAFPQARAAGVAGISRSQTPQWMREHLPSIFLSLQALNPAIAHYKVCSTFDSSPDIGSIGCALELGAELFGSPWVPLVIGAPVLRRYMVFGNLFAAVDGVAYRLDRHPTMAHHPVTPMGESDLRLHLSRQTGLQLGLVDILALHGGLADEKLTQVLEAGHRGVFFDVLDQQSLEEAGRLIWTRRPPGTLFAVGSSGLEYALVEYWRKSGQILEPEPCFQAVEPGRVAVVSGSCSPVTGGQIRHARAHGFAAVALDVARLAGADGEMAMEAAVRAGDEALADGRSVVLYSALGAEGVVDPGCASAKVELSDRIGAQLGRILERLIRRTGVRRVIVCGGDTSGHAAQQLRIQALTMIRPIAPGGPLCRAHSSDPEFQGLEIIFKGGQVGQESYLRVVRDGLGALP